jgi:hypothetical protein
MIDGICYYLGFIFCCACLQQALVDSQMFVLKRVDCLYRYVKRKPNRKTTTKELTSKDLDTLAKMIIKRDRRKEEIRPNE